MFCHNLTIISIILIKLHNQIEMFALIMSDIVFSSYWLFLLIVSIFMMYVIYYMNVHYISRKIF